MGWVGVEGRGVDGEGVAAFAVGGGEGGEEEGEEEGWEVHVSN